MNYEDRIKGRTGAFNHVAHFDTLHTQIMDGYPICVWAPTHWETIEPESLEGRLLKSGKKIELVCVD